ncbi:MAG: DUF3299 domain-containing protein [Candidatus Hydrogenedentes bacterium]|nr:DUF3299 domain-containing protein [Candidatus Hydrogenedentota bacterium]
MRRRVIRDLGTLLGIVVVLAGVVGINIYMRLGTLQEKFDRIRRAEEAKQIQQGRNLLDWELLRLTKGKLGKDTKFPEDLKPKNGTTVNLIGFMTPIDQFRDAEYFMLLPLPIQCYFCEAPPMRDVMLVRMAEGHKVNLVEEPVLITGELVLNEGSADVFPEKFYYKLTNATFNTKDKNLTPKNIRKQDRQEGAKQGGQLLQGGEHIPNSVPEEELLKGIDAPSASEAPKQSPS